VLVVGVAYKRNIDDARESPSAEIIEMLRDRGAHVSYHDPHIPEFPTMRRHAIDLRSVPLSDDALAASDCVLILTDHDAVDYGAIAHHARLVIDTRNAMARVPAGTARARIVKS
jgi:UDP-N-acetyl-D-glucosamine dehydrogenase